MTDQTKVHPDRYPEAPTPPGVEPFPIGPVSDIRGPVRKSADPAGTNDKA